MRTYNVAEAKAHFSELMQRALRGEEIVIAKDNKPLLKVVPVRTQKGARKPGSGKGQLLYMAEDFNAALSDFEDYTR